MIVETDPFIARDMSDGLMEAAPGCTVEIFRSAEELADLPSAPAAPHPVIVTKLSLEAIESSGLATSAARMGAMIVVRQGEDTADAVSARGWLSLPTPFTCEDLFELASSLRLRISAA